MKLGAVVLAVSFVAGCGSAAAPPPSPTPPENKDVVPPASPTAAPALPARVPGRYALATTARHPVPLPPARVFVTIDAGGALRAGTLGADALDAGTLVGMPRQVTFAADDTPAGTPPLRDTVAALLGSAGAAAPPHLLDDAQREELRTSGCTRVPPGPRAISWGYSKDLRLEVVAFVRAPGDPATAPVVIAADAAAPAIRLVQAADEVPVARIAVDRGAGGAQGLAFDVGGAVALADPICLASNRRIEVTTAAIDVHGDGIVHAGFGTIPVANHQFDHDALVRAFAASLAARELDGRHAVVDVDHDVSVALLVGVLDALVEAGGTAFVLHTRPNLRRPPVLRTGTPRP